MNENSPSHSELIFRATALGVQPEYYDVEGRLHTASDESLLRVIEALSDSYPGAGDASHIALDSTDESKPELTPLYSESPRRRWGLFAPLYALRSKLDWGIGSFTEAATLLRWLGKQGGSFWGTLPLFAGSLGGEPVVSPYWPVSRLFLNDLFIDPTLLPEFAASDAVQRLVRSSSFKKRLKSLRETALVDYAGVSSLKRQALSLLADEFFATPLAGRREAYEEFRSRQPRLDDFVEYLVERETQRDDGAPLRRYHLYAEWAADEQLRWLKSIAESSGVELYLDLPVGSHPAGYDVSAFTGEFARGVSVGAPPDPLGPEGQNWGFPPLHPQRMRDTGFRYLREVLAGLTETAGMLRIDHVMGFRRLFWIPTGMSGRDGVYVSYPWRELTGLLAAASQRNRCIIIGEDLGTVPDEVREEMKRIGMKGLYIIPFEMDGASLRLPRPDQVASLNTHDLVPFAGFMQGADIRDRLERGLLTDEGAAWEHEGRRRFREAAARSYVKAELMEEADSSRVEQLTDAAHHFLAASDAGVLLINIEDLWFEIEPQNRPGTVEPVPNWRKKLKLTVEDIIKSDELAGKLRLIGEYRSSTGGVMNKRSTSGGKVKSAPAPKPVVIGEVKPVFRLTDDDRYLFNEGSHVRLWDKLGSHPGAVDGEAGVHFAVWAPDAVSVHVIGDFNGWNNNTHSLYPNGQSGVWEGFIPGLPKTSIYKYFVRGRFNGFQAEKADPFSLHCETPPKTGSIVWEAEYQWSDGDWMASRGDRSRLDSPISIYEMHLGSWRRIVEDGDRSPSYRELAEFLPNYLKETGFTHVEFLPVMEHPFYGSWGYQTTGFFAPTSRYGTPEDLKLLIDKLHQAGIGVILDWVPSHFPADGHGLARFDGTHLYEHADGRQGFHPDWGSMIFNYDRNEVRSFLLSSAFYWLDQFHADGLRVDAVASMLYLDYSRKAGEWIPNQYGGRENIGAIEFLRRLNAEVYAHFPGVQMIAEESTAWPMVSRPTYLGGLGFGLKWDMGWMHDALDYFDKDPVYRHFHHNNLTFRMLYAWHENFVLPLSHDEVVHMKGSLLGRMPGDLWQKFANLRLLFTFQMTQPGKKLLFMGGEIGQWGEWNHDRSLDWHLLEYPSHQGLKRLISDLNSHYRNEAALHEMDCDPSGFEWIDCNDADASAVSFLRWNRDRSESVVVILSFTPVTRFDYRIGLPHGGIWREIFNSDSEHYGGSGKGNFGEVNASGEPFHGRPDSAVITLPPLGGVMLRG